ncbi:MAG TPA: ABC transporter permease [Bryobacteraceae bacterium]|nr:ABC transporter permease [Bryobacteraceae bacterium]
MTLLPQTLRYSLRFLAKSPGFTAVAVLALAFGIGANTAIYSLADILLFRPLLLPNLDRIVTVIGTEKNNPKGFSEVSPADFLDLQRSTKTIEYLAAAAQANRNLTGDGQPERVNTARVSAGFLTGLGAQPVLGRAFLDSENMPGQEREVLLSYNLWTGRFASDPNILARTIQLDGQVHRVVGVMPNDFCYPPQTDLWVPLAMDARMRSERVAGTLAVIGRLKTGVSLAQARSEIGSLAARISEQFPESHGNRTERVELLREYVSGNLVAEFTRMLLGSVAFVLLIACLNVANLQFARASLRSREIAIRTALGASRFRVVSQFLTESTLLGILGAGGGIVLAYWGLHLMRPAIPPAVQRELPGWVHLGINSHVLLFTMAIAVLAGVVSGIAPAWFGSRAALNEMLKESGRGTSAGRRRHRVRSVLVAGQIVLALVLLVGAGLIAKGSRLVSDPAPNLDPEKALTMRINLSSAKYASPSEPATFQQQLLGSLRALPGVTAAGIVSNLPYSGSFTNANVTVEGHYTRQTDTTPSALNQRASPGYFRALQLSLREGRAFTESDGPGSQQVAIVSRNFALRFLPGENPIGKRIKIGLASENADWLTIVGVVSDLRINPFDKFNRPVVYRASQQTPPRSFDVLIRTSGDPKALAAAARAQVAAIDRDQPVYQFMTLDALFNDQLSGFRFLAVLMGIFGFIALFLASIGVYAVMAHSVNERTHEIGVRMALGAREPDVLWMIVRRGLVLTMSGLLIGLPATLALTRLLASVFFGVNEYDPATFATGLIALSAAALLACYIPARRATKVDPMVTLRTD